MTIRSKDKSLFDTVLAFLLRMSAIVVVASKKKENEGKGIKN